MVSTCLLTRCVRRCCGTQQQPLSAVGRNLGRRGPVTLAAVSIGAAFSVGGRHHHAGVLLLSPTALLLLCVTLRRFKRLTSPTPSRRPELSQRPTLEQRFYSALCRASLTPGVVPMQSVVESLCVAQHIRAQHTTDCGRRAPVESVGCASEQRLYSTAHARLRHTLRSSLLTSCLFQRGEALRPHSLVSPRRGEPRAHVDGMAHSRDERWPLRCPLLAECARMCRCCALSTASQSTLSILQKRKRVTLCARVVKEPGEGLALNLAGQFLSSRRPFLLVWPFRCATCEQARSHACTVAPCKQVVQCSSDTIGSLLLMVAAERGGSPCRLCAARLWCLHGMVA